VYASIAVEMNEKYSAELVRLLTENTRLKSELEDAVLHADAFKADYHMAESELELYKLCRTCGFVAGCEEQPDDCREYGEIKGGGDE
jgi:hypothetical protein